MLPVRFELTSFQHYWNVLPYIIEAIYMNCNYIPAPRRGRGYTVFYTPAPRRGRGVYCFTTVLLSVQDIFRRIFLSNCWWHKSDIWSPVSYRYTMLWVAFFGPVRFLLPVCRLIIPPLPKGGGGYTVLPLSILPSVQDIFRHIFLSNCWWQKSDIWSQASYRYPISWEAFLDPSDSYFLFADFVDFYTHLTYICICTFFVAFF